MSLPVRSHVRAAALGGVAFTVLQVVSGTLVSERPDVHDGAAVAAFVTTNRTLLLVGVLLSLAAVVPYAVLARAMPAMAGSDLGPLAASAGWAAVAVSASGSAFGLLAIAEGAAGGELARLAWHAQLLSYLVIAVPAAVMVVAFGRGLAGTTGVAWVGSAATVVAGVLLASVLSVLADSGPLTPTGSLIGLRDLPFGAWMLAASVVAWRWTGRGEVAGVSEHHAVASIASA